MTADRWVRPDIAGLEEYAAVTPPEIIARRLGLAADQILKLDANENPYGPSPLVAEALARTRVDLYPDPEHTALREAIAGYAGAPPERIMFGNGSDELLELTIRLLTQPGDETISCGPTFGMYSFLPPLFLGRVVEVPRTDGFDVDVSAVLGAITDRTKLIVISTPNNPTGNPLAEADLQRLLDSGRVVVLDEAYIEFAGTCSAVRLTAEYDNLIVLRTFSKWAGLAGLRVGYGVFPDALIKHLWKIKQPYNVNVAAGCAVLSSLSDRESLLENVGRIVTERARLASRLAALPGWTVYPSSANFLLCRVPEARAVKDRLLRQGILVRSYFGTARLEDCLRISVGRPADTDRLLEALSREVRE